jgi:exopolysaccharide biosynthesis polyprenyl glycosylphosphotransferase
MTPVPNPHPGPKRGAFSEFVRSRPAIMIFAVCVDALTAATSALISVWWVSKTEPHTPPVWMVLLFVPIVLGLLAARGMYRRKLNHSFLDEIGTIETTVALSAMLFLSLMVATKTIGFLGATVFTIWLCAAVLLPVGRLVRAMVERLLRRHHHLTAPILVVGNGRIAGRIVDRLKATPDYGLLPVGLVDAEVPWSGPDENSKIDLPYLGIPEEFEKAVVETGAEGVIIAFSLSRDELLTQVVRISHRHGLRVWVVPRMFDVVGERAWIEHIGGLPLLAFPHTNPQGWQFALKHVSDRVAAALGLLLISPLFLTLTLLVRLSSPGPIFFRQPRVGRDGKVFDCLKFRSMRPPRASDAEFELKDGAAPGGVEGVDRRTKIGKIMRMTSMDELPQLINVLKGEMSMVGPRPERPEFVELFEMQIRRYGERHRVKAGITGWAQVHGLRGQTSIADRAEWDNYYIENWSMGLDLKILVLTVLAVLKRAE